MRGKLEFISSRIFRYMLFVSSYLPLFAIIFLMNIENLYLSFILIAVMMTTLLTLKLYLDHPLGAKPNKKVVVTSISNNGNEALNYIVTYIVPFISFNGDVFQSEQGLSMPILIAFIILFLVIGNLYMSNNLYYINPILTLFYDIHIATEVTGKDTIIISNKSSDIPLKTSIYMRSVSPKVLLYTKDTKNKLTYNKMILFLILLIVFLYLWNFQFQDCISELINRFSQS